MAIITFDEDNVSILVEKDDVIQEIKDSVTYIKSASRYTIGSVIGNGKANLCVVRGEREK